MSGAGGSYATISARYPASLTVELPPTQLVTLMLVPSLKAPCSYCIQLLHTTFKFGRQPASIGGRSGTVPAVSSAAVLTWSPLQSVDAGYLLHGLAYHLPKRKNPATILSSPHLLQSPPVCFSATSTRIESWSEHGVATSAQALRRHWAKEPPAN